MTELELHYEVLDDPIGWSHSHSSVATVSEAIFQREAMLDSSTDKYRNFHLYEWTDEGFKEIEIPEVES